MREILPGILEKDWEEIEKKIILVKPFAKAIHIDLLDGKFAPNTSFSDPKPFAKYSQDIFFELHMMVEEPEEYLEEWAHAGIRRFLGHVEKMSNQASFVARAQNVGEVGLVLDGKTQLDALRVSLNDLDTVLIMTYNAGFSGQEFQPQQLTKVRELAARTSIPLEVDGGINDTTIVQALRAGATRFVATSYLFWNTKDPHHQYMKLLSRCTSESERG